MSHAMSVLGLLVEEPKSIGDVTTILMHTTMLRFCPDQEERWRTIRAIVHAGIEELLDHGLAKKKSRGRWIATKAGEDLIVATRAAYRKRQQQQPSKQRRQARRLADGLIPAGRQAEAMARPEDEGIIKP